MPVVEQSRQKMVTLNGFDDGIVGDYEPHFGYCSFNDDLFFSYNDQLRTIEIRNRESGATDVFVVQK